MKIIQINKAEQMTEVASQLLEQIAKSQFEGAVVVALDGELGAGKTTLVQNFAKILGVKDLVTSPTYVVMKGYELETDTLPPTLKHFKNLLHIDAYRIEDIDEMRVLKFPELLVKKDTIICIEWPKHIAPLIPADAIKVSIKLKDTSREVLIS